VENGQSVGAGTVLLYPTAPPAEAEVLPPAVAGEQPVVARVAGQVLMENEHFYIKYGEREERE
jgi:hypothetical protein